MSSQGWCWRNTRPMEDTPPGTYSSTMPLNETSHAWHHGDEQLVSIILKGLRRTKNMPSFKGVISEKEAYDIVAYIKSLWSPRIIACQGPKHMTIVSRARDRFGTSVRQIDSLSSTAIMPRPPSSVPLRAIGLTARGLL